jgi:ABC-type maltose transport system permease subunit
MPYIITAHTISSNPKKVETNERSTFEKIFTVLALLSTLFSSVAGIVALYEAEAKRGCRPGIGTAIMVLQGIATLLGYAAICIALGSEFEGSNKVSSVTCMRYDFSITTNTSKPTALLVALTLFIETGICYVMAGLILRDQMRDEGCGNVTWNSIYNGTAIIGACIVVLLTSFPIKKHREEQDVHHHQYSRAPTLSEYYRQRQQKQRQQNPVPN